MIGDMEVHDLPPFMPEDYEAEQGAEGHGGNGEEVQSDGLSGMVLEESTPAWRWRPGLAHGPQILGHGGLGHGVAKP